jgi:hypothetical protein
VGLWTTIGMVVEPNPNRPFLLTYGLLKLVVLISTKITCAYPKNDKGCPDLLSERGVDGDDGDEDT